jgi:hypothetical protein
LALLAPLTLRRRRRLDLHAGLRLALRRLRLALLRVLLLRRMLAALWAPVLLLRRAAILAPATAPSVLFAPAAIPALRLRE